jgi:hypothetical protein
MSPHIRIGPFLARTLSLTLRASEHADFSLSINTHTLISSLYYTLAPQLRSRAARFHAHKNIPHRSKVRLQISDY